MDTIIYLYHSREAQKYSIEKWQEKEYCLIRLGIPVPLWKNLHLLEQGLEESKDAERFEDGVKSGSGSGKATESERTLQKSIKPKWFAGKKRKRKRQKLEETLQAGLAEQGTQLTQEKQEQRLRRQEERQKLQKEIKPLLDELSELQTALCLLGDNPHWTYCVYEDYLREKIDTKLWWECWKLPEFREYHEFVWAEALMQSATKDSFLILGYAPCVGTILNRHATKTRNVKWIMKPEQYTEAVQEFIEAFYQEYGLAISVQLLEEGEEWIRFRPSGVMAVNVLDFSGEEKLSACDVGKGSIWLDMDSLEGKERRIETRCPQIAYFSLKKQWSHLDTIHKNRYNT